jgi:hypothetical protein
MYLDVRDNYIFTPLDSIINDFNSSLLAATTATAASSSSSASGAASNLPSSPSLLPSSPFPFSPSPLPPSLATYNNNDNTQSNNNHLNNIFSSLSRPRSRNSLNSNSNNNNSSTAPVSYNSPSPSPPPPQAPTLPYHERPSLAFLNKNENVVGGGGANSSNRKKKKESKNVDPVAWMGIELDGNKSVFLPGQRVEGIFIHSYDYSILLYCFCAKFHSLTCFVSSFSICPSFLFSILCTHLKYYIRHFFETHFLITKIC